MHHILCGSPFIPRDFYAIRPPILRLILGAYFLLIWGVGGGQNYLHTWCIATGEAQKNPLSDDLLGGFAFSGSLVF